MMPCPLDRTPTPAQSHFIQTRCLVWVSYSWWVNHNIHWRESREFLERLKHVKGPSGVFLQQSFCVSCQNTMCESGLTIMLNTFPSSWSICKDFLNTLNIAYFSYLFASKLSSSSFVVCWDIATFICTSPPLTVKLTEMCHVVLKQNEDPFMETLFHSAPKKNLQRVSLKSVYNHSLVWSVEVCSPDLR